jgi:hypothetical protein
VTVATALPKTSWAQIKTPAGVTLISLEIKSKIATFARPKHQPMGPNLTGRR